MATSGQQQHRCRKRRVTAFRVDLSQRVMRMRGAQKINHFPGMHAICRKGDLARSLRRMQREHPEDYSFSPKTWVLPSDLTEFKDEVMMANAARRVGERGHTANSSKNSRNTKSSSTSSTGSTGVINKENRGNTKTKRRTYYIVKPVGGCQGKNIFLTSGWKRAARIQQEPAVVQRYVSNPLLIDGFKFDLRVYVLVTSVCPLRVMLHKRGLVRLCTHQYRSPRNRNLKNTRMHLTNYAINKGSQNFISPSAESCRPANYPPTTSKALPGGSGAPAEDGNGSAEETTCGSWKDSHASPEKRRTTIFEGGDGWPAERRTSVNKRGNVDGLGGSSVDCSRGNEEGENGSKRSLEWFFRWLDRGGRDSAALWREVAGLVVKTLATAQPSLARAYRACFCEETRRKGTNHGRWKGRQRHWTGKDNGRCFELLGYDVLIDANLRPWLLEVNHSPSFKCDTPLDYSVKRDVVYDTMRVVDVRPGDYRCHEQKKTMATGSVDARSNTPSKTSDVGKGAADDDTTGGFELIYPPPRGEDSSRGRSFTRFLKTSQALLDRATGVAAYTLDRKSRRNYSKDFGGGDSSDSDSESDSDNSSGSRSCSPIEGEKFKTSASGVPQLHMHAWGPRGEERSMRTVESSVVADGNTHLGPRDNATTKSTQWGTPSTPAISESQQRAVDNHRRRYCPDSHLGKDLDQKHIGPSSHLHCTRPALSPTPKISYVIKDTKLPSTTSAPHKREGDSLGTSAEGREYTAGQRSMRRLPRPFPHRSKENEYPARSRVWKHRATSAPPRRTLGSQTGSSFSGEDLTSGSVLAYNAIGSSALKKKFRALNAAVTEVAVYTAGRVQPDEKTSGCKTKTFLMTDASQWTGKVKKNTSVVFVDATETACIGGEGNQTLVSPQRQTERPFDADGGGSGGMCRGAQALLKTSHLSRSSPFSLSPGTADTASIYKKSRSDPPSVHGAVAGDNACMGSSCRGRANRNSRNFGQSRTGDDAIANIRSSRARGGGEARNDKALVRRRAVPNRVSILEMKRFSRGASLGNRFRRPEGLMERAGFDPF